MNCLIWVPTLIAILHAVVAEVTAGNVSRPPLINFTSSSDLSDPLLLHERLGAEQSILPDKLLIGYASWNECDDKITTAVEQGVNVVIWFAINLLTDPHTGEPIITGGPNLTCVAEKKAEYEARGLATVHLISIGGWNAPHPDTSVPAADVYANWVKWNNNLFAGFDWDIEGNDSVQSPYNQFTEACLDLMGEMSRLAKADGFIVSMAPAESYLDLTTATFDLSLRHNYPEWEVLQPNFHYHGHNTYAYLLQLYESYSHAVYNISVLETPAAEYLVSFMQKLLAGWDVDYSEGGEKLLIPADRLVIGLANGWADGKKSVRVWPEEAGVAYAALGDQQPRGFMFWDIADEGLVPSGSSREMWMAAGLNSFLHTRR